MATEKTEPTRANVEPPMPTRGASAWRRVRAWGPWLLGLSVAVRLAWAYLTPHGADLVDLHVYVS
ncbi:alpha-(1-2)-phosphatidylinositol mannosyltransferase, partial [Staphylococcus capitis]|nr:alpha-(1-2)-phosphatidylinositol mannosyltransferase [Staphylococcus capitis]